MSAMQLYCIFYASIFLILVGYVADVIIHQIKSIAITLERIARAQERNHEPH